MAAHPSISPALQAQLDVLREAYAAKLDEKIAQIDESWAEVLAQSDAKLRQEALETLHRLTHSLAGSGATFGFPAVSTAARRAETLLKALLDSAEPLSSEKQGQVKLTLDDLRDSAQAKRQESALFDPDELTTTQSQNNSLFLFSDSPAGLPIWATSLQAFGYELEFFDHPADLKRVWHQRQPSAIIVDCESEPMKCSRDGLLLSSVLSEAPRDVETPTPVIWTCLRDDVRARLQAVRLGGAAFFPQPVDVDSLLVKLDDLTAHVAPEPIRVLIVDDEPSLGRLFSVILRQSGMETFIVSDPLHIMEPLVDFRPDLILMDIYMPGCSGIEVASVIRQQEAYIGIPIVFLSVETDVFKQLEAMRQGGDDFLIKPVQPRHLVSAVTTRATRARLLRNLMVRDSLTGLLNHTKTKEQLSIELDRARRLGHPVSLAMLDLDNFKRVNDAYGHATGDRVLRSLSRLLGQRLRQTDVIGRYGGEEFAVILNGSTAQDAKNKLETVRAAFASLPHFSDGREFRVTFSAGIASSPPFHNAAAISEAADRALYQAKHAGRDQISLAESNTMWTNREPL